MDTTEAITLAVVPAALTLTGTLAGFWINHWFESRRQETQRESARAERRREIRRNLLEQLQHAMAEVRDGAGAGNWILFLDKERGAQAMKAALGESWFREWQSAARRVSILTAQIDDDELKQAVSALGVNSDQLQAINRGDRQALDETRKQLDRVYDRANARAGQLIQELDRA